MLIGPRPNLGWLLYIYVGKSWYKMASLVLFFICATLTLLKRSKDSLNLQYMRPSHFPPPVIILPPPSQSTLSSFDACAIEAVTSRVAVHRNYNFPKKPTPVYVYLWSASIPSTDIWTRTIRKLNGVNLVYMDLSKALNNVPIYGEFSTGVWSTNPEWVLWMAAGGSLLWKSGGILLPTGVLATSPLYLDMVEENTGLLITGKNRTRHVAIGSKMNHPLIEILLMGLENYKSFEKSTQNETGEFGPLNNLLTSAVDRTCQTENLELIRESEICREFTILDASAIWKFDFETPVITKSHGDTSFLQYVGDNKQLSQNLRATNRLFQRHGFQKYCPYVHRQLEKLILDPL